MPLEWDLIIFLFVAAMTIVAALLIIWSKEIVRSIMWLTLAFLGVGFTYIFLGAEYLAMIQFTIYVGAVSVLMLFGIMLTKRRLLGGDRDE
jgi:NADH-quinone oxidoreductase subunit J